jgi:hypothetical protein
MRNEMKKYPAVVAAVLFGGVFAAPLFGASSAYFLTRPPSARAAALGDAFGAIEDDVSGVKYNPGSLSTLTHRQLAVMYNKGFADDTHANVTGGMPFKSGVAGFSLDYYDAGSLEFFDSAWNEKTVSAERNFALGVSYGRKLSFCGREINAGATLKYVSSTLVEYKTATAIAADFGALYSFENAPVTCGLSFLNIGTPLKYISEGDPLPASARLSGRYQFENYFVITDASYLIFDKVVVPSVGVEYALKNIAALRCGYKFNSDVEGLSFGVGSRVKNFGINYSFGLNKILGNSHLISITMYFPR